MPNLVGAQQKAVTDLRSDQSEDCEATITKTDNSYSQVDGDSDTEPNITNALIEVWKTMQKTTSSHRPPSRYDVYDTDQDNDSDTDPEEDRVRRESLARDERKIWAKVYSRAHYQANKEAYKDKNKKAYGKAYYQVNKEKIAAYYQANKEKISANRAAYRARLRAEKEAEKERRRAEKEHGEAVQRIIESNNSLKNIFT